MADFGPGFSCSSTKCRNSLSKPVCLALLNKTPETTADIYGCCVVTEMYHSQILVNLSASQFFGVVWGEFYKRRPHSVRFPPRYLTRQPHVSTCPCENRRYRKAPRSQI